MKRRRLECSEAREMLAETELGLELEAARQEALAAHLAECERCREARGREAELSGLLESAVGDLGGGTRELAERIAAGIPERAPVVATRWRRLEAVAAVLLFGAGLAVGLLVRGGSGTEGGGSAREPLGAPVAATPIRMGGSEEFSQQLLPSDRLRTRGFLRGVLVDPQNPGDMTIEMEVESVVEDPSPPDLYR